MQATYQVCITEMGVAKGILKGIGSRYKAWLLLNLEQNVIISVN